MNMRQTVAWSLRAAAGLAVIGTIALVVIAAAVDER